MRYSTASNARACGWLRWSCARSTRETAQEHYAEHVGKPFFDPLIGFITSGAAGSGGRRGSAGDRDLASDDGSTDPVKAPSGTIRGDFGLIVTENLVHGSDSPASAAREVALFFPNLLA